MLPTMVRLKAKDCCFCDHYKVFTDYHGMVVKRGCTKKDLYVPEFKVQQGLDCFLRSSGEKA